MVQSMTGFGKSQVILSDKTVNIEIKSLNSKQQDISVRMPGIFKSKEMEIRNKLVTALVRGKVEFSMYVDFTGEVVNYKINESAVKGYFNQMKGLLNVDALTPEILSIIMRMPEVTNSEKEEVAEDEWDKISQGIDEAIQNIIQFRLDEGASLAKDLLYRVECIEKGLESVKDFDVIRIENLKAKMHNAIAEIQENLVDKNRFEQELIYYLEKLDISEEKVRLKQHCEYFRNTLNGEEGVGKKLGFIAQEMGREINTTGSKANDVQIQKAVVQMKDDLEKIKEQVLNVL